jgi:hypothetical protein
MHDTVSGNESDSAAKSSKARSSKRTTALSGFSVAHPGCTHPLINSGTEFSDDLVVGHIFHLYAFGKKGPRGKPALCVSSELYIRLADFHADKLRLKSTERTEWGCTLPASKF